MAASKKISVPFDGLILPMQPTRIPFGKPSDSFKEVLSTGGAKAFVSIPCIKTVDGTSRKV